MEVPRKFTDDVVDRECENLLKLCPDLGKYHKVTLIYSYSGSSQVSSQKEDWLSYYSPQAAK